MADNTTMEDVKLKPKDFSSSQDVRWCPGCGDYSILAQVQRVSPDFGVDKENFVWISGIGCSSRFPYYMDTYGMHGIHGRAPAIATGIKLQNPKLSVWVATGDGDLLSIGGNHFIHACRRNIGIKIILFNNKIYGLTKGQFSPTSEKGKITASSPYGSVDYPFNPAALAIGSDATFVARSIDRDPKHLKEIISRAASHTGTAFVEVFQNCNIFNDGTFFTYTEKETKFDNVISIKHDKPMVFGKDNEKGIILDGFTPRVVSLTDGKYSVNDLWIHNEHDLHASRAHIISQFQNFEGVPTPIGVFRHVDKPSFDHELHEQIDNIVKKEGKGNLKDLLYKTNTWEVN
ncbi:MAG: 2-oxoacid:ferredoxin oxidoreductase subunit beta [Ignavibacteriales bacterium CG_4_9_14_3_um_filter_30_11]|nr:MAG: 2-oxoacid:ferredoxin oxidoreductase subunit beta [Ignavibacteriales bacterium CG_4_9_14_3_um_filter_30_11]